MKATGAKKGRKATGRLRTPVNVTLPEELKTELGRMAFAADMSVSRFLQVLVEERIAVEGRETGVGKGVAP